METENKKSVKIKRQNKVNRFMLLQQTINTRNSVSKNNFHKKNDT